MNLTVPAETTRQDIEESILHLRERQRRAVIPSTADEYGRLIDVLIEAWTQS